MPEAVHPASSARRVLSVSLDLRGGEKHRRTRSYLVLAHNHRLRVCGRHGHLHQEYRRNISQHCQCCAIGRPLTRRAPCLCRLCLRNLPRAHNLGYSHRNSYLSQVLLGFFVPPVEPVVVWSDVFFGRHPRPF